MSWAQLKEMEQAGWDVQSHTHSHPNLTQIDDSSLFGELAYSQLLLRQRLGVEANYIATPFGEFDERVMNFVTKQYQAHFRAWGGNEGFNDLTNLDPYNVGRYEVKADYTVDHVCGIVSDLHPNTWLVFEFHKVVEAQEIKPYEVSKEILEKIVDCTVVQEKLGKIRIMTANQVLEKGEW
jgi:peptidoglycan/xylan/chitin deacetylase (PgdA/CDA1 family)